MLRRVLADALIASGTRAERGGRLDTACRRYRAAAAVAPTHAPALLNLGAALEAAGDAAAAERAYASLLVADPGNAYASYNLGRLRHARGDHAQAERLLRQALDRKPQFADALLLLAAVLEARGDAAGAEQSLRAALAVEPRHALASLHVGRLAHARGDFAQAEPLLRGALQSRPDLAEAHCLHGEVLLKLGRPQEAEIALRCSLELDPGQPGAWHTLGCLLRTVSRIRESLDAFAEARRLEPGRLDLEPMELLSLTLFDEITAEKLFERHRDYGARLEASVVPRFRPWRNTRDPERRLRVGFVSCDFNRHPVAWFCLPLFEHLDRVRCEVFCYATGRQADDVTARVCAVADAWREAADLSDAQLADAIHDDGVDVLVDLTGHAGVARLGVFAQQPAPVQVSWLGYLNTTGLTRIQYRVTDARSDPPETGQRQHTETLAYLPHSLWCYRPWHTVAHAPEAPCKRNSFVTFGSFNHAPKLSATVRRLWADILRRMPQSRLLLLGVPEGRLRDDLMREFTAAGIAASRLKILPRVAPDAYVQQFDEVDMALDTTPYGGGTTTFDALWMGVPVLTLAGDRPASRSAASILGALGMQDWIAASADDYVRLALARAADPVSIGELRTTLRRRLQESPLMDEARFARDMETAYRDMWHAWCARPMS